MSKSRFENLLFEACSEIKDSQHLRDALEDALKEAEEDGYENGYGDGKSDAEIDSDRADEGALAQSVKDVEALKTRYRYLKYGGRWNRERDAEGYLAGFEDAMKTLGVLP